MTNYRASFVLRVREIRGLVKVSLQNLKTGQKEEFGSWQEAWRWLEHQQKQQGLR